MRVPLWNTKEKADMPEKEHVEASTAKAALQLHPVSSRNGLIAKIEPPREPTQKIKHAPCDIVLVIDVSASMCTRADVPGDEPTEKTGLKVLDLVKHAARTIMETLDDGDRLGVVIFSSATEIVQELTPMTKENKDSCWEKVKKVRPTDMTNLWHGILDGIKVVKNGGSSSRTPAIMVLTDGLPNHMCPPQGYITKLRTMLPLPAPIHTFGFGYSLKSGLLKSIAEISGGNYSFIPDAGMVGTVFVHSVANLQSTFATKAVVELHYSKPLELEECMGTSVDQEAPKEDGDHRTLRISLGNIQYGQSRDIFIKVKNVPSADPFDGKGLASVKASLSYQRSSELAAVEGAKEVNASDTLCVSVAECSMLADSDLSDSEAAFHESRAQICQFLSSIFPIGENEYHAAIEPEKLPEKQDELTALIANIPANKYDDPLNKSLMEDLAGKEPKGQISLALGKEEYYSRWGHHYLPSLLNAHVRQACNSFKDPGPLQYGANSPLFKACRDNLDAAFDSLPAPEPSLPQMQNGQYTSGPVSISMARFHNAAGVCFAGSTPVELASGKKVAIRKLRRGMKVRTPAGPRKVAVVLKTPVEEEALCQVGSVLTTPWHPISADSKTWDFPAHCADKVVRYTGAIYSIMLQRDSNLKAHGMRLGEGLWGVTLGHGLVAGSDVRAHEFFGDFQRVGKALVSMGIGKNGVVVGHGVNRDEQSGLVVGFKGVQ